MTHGGEEARLGLACVHRLIARLGELKLCRTLLGDVAADALHLAHPAVDVGDDEILPHEPAGSRGGGKLDHTASPRLAFFRPGRGLLPFRAQDRELKHLTQRPVAGNPESPAEGIVDEAEPLLGVAAEDHVALVIEEIAIASLPFAHLPLQVLQRFEALIEAIGEGRETRVAASLPPRGDQRHEDGDAERERQRRNGYGAPQRREGGDDQRGGEKSERRAKSDTGHGIVAEIA